MVIIGSAIGAIYHIVTNILSVINSILLPDTHHVQIPPSHKEKGLVAIGRYLGCTESTVLILDNPMNSAMSKRVHKPMKQALCHASM